MAQNQLATLHPEQKKTFVYCKDTVRIHAVSVKFLKIGRTCHLKEFSLLDDAHVKCRPRVVYDSGEQTYFFEIEFSTIVPKENKCKISICYIDKLGQLVCTSILNAENIRQGDKFKLTCHDAFVEENDIAGNITLWSKIYRKDSMYVFQQKPPDFSQITDCFLLFENSALSNLTISVEGREFRVHEEILAAKSSFFLVMFETEMKEKRENHVIIEDIEVNIFQEFLLYIYTNTVNDLNANAEKLYKAADKYDLPKLKLICIDEFARSLNVENAINMFLFADDNNVTLSKERSMDFVKKHIETIFQTEGYKALCQSPKAYIIKEIFRATVEYFKKLK